MNESVKSQLRFEPEWRITLFTLFFVPAMIGLGFWQLQRAEEKTEILAVSSARQAQAPQLIDGLLQAEPDELAYLPVLMEGEYVPGRHFLLDNRIYQGRFGFEVITPFRLERSDHLVMVNRGWIAGDPARLTWPEIEDVRGKLALTGKVYVPHGEPYTLGETPLDDKWPRVLPHFDADLIVASLDQADNLFAFEVRLDTASPGALVSDWITVNATPEKHTSYAVQWFTMAAVLALFYFYRSSNVGSLFKSRRSESEL